MTTGEKQLTIEERNKLIAEFMGYKIFKSPYGLNGLCKDEKDMSTWLHFNSLEYHLLWDWLMPVVEKISKVVIKGTAPFNSDQYVRVEIVPNGYVEISNLRAEPIFANVCVEKSLIAAVYKAVVQFIQWYNSQSIQTNK